MNDQIRGTIENDIKQPRPLQNPVPAPVMPLVVSSWFIELFSKRYNQVLNKLLKQNCCCVNSL